MEIAIAAFFGAFATIVVAIIGLYGARKAGIGVTQERLVSNLKDLVEAQGYTINNLERKAKMQDTRISELETQVDKLQKLTISQALTIDRLSSKRKIIIQSPENGDTH
jgi:hypothetical protein